MSSEFRDDVIYEKDLQPEERIKDAVCPQCKKPFRLIWNSYTFIEEHATAKQTLFIRDCPSGGVYDVYVVCPHCDYEEYF